MRTITRSALAVLVTLVAACGPSADKTGEPQTPPPTTEPAATPETGQTGSALTPAAGEGSETPEATKPEPATPAAPPPLTLKHGEMSHQIQHVVLVRDPIKKGKDKLWFFSAHVTCDEVIAAKNKPLASTVLGTDVKSGEGSIELAQPMKLTLYMEGKATPINAKKEDVTLSLQESGGKMSGNLKVAAKIKKDDVAVDGPFEATLCEVPAPAAKTPAAKAPAGEKAPAGTPPSGKSAPAKK